MYNSGIHQTGLWSRQQEFQVWLGSVQPKTRQIPGCPTHCSCNGGKNTILANSESARWPSRGGCTTTYEENYVELFYMFFLQLQQEDKHQVSSINGILSKHGWLQAPGLQEAYLSYNRIFKSLWNHAVHTENVSQWVHNRNSIKEVLDHILELFWVKCSFVFMRICFQLFLKRLK